MGTGRRLVVSLAAAASCAAAVPAGAAAQGPVPGCTLPHAWTDAPVGIQYEVELFRGQTAFDLARVTPSNAAAFTSVTVKRATSLTNALAGIGVSVVTGGISQPPRCP